MCVYIYIYTNLYIQYIDIIHVACLRKLVCVH